MLKINTLEQNFAQKISVITLLITELS